MVCAGNMQLTTVSLLAVFTGCGWGFVCDFGWINFGDSCYMFGVNKSVPLLQAKLCHSMGAVLVEIETETENGFLKTYLLYQHRKEEYWLGLTDNVMGSKWTWYDSLTEVTYSEWRPNEPNNSDGENCAVMAQQEYTWNDVHCRDIHEPICEISYPATTGVVG